MILSDFIKYVPKYCEENLMELQQITAFRNAVETIYVHYTMERKLAYDEMNRMFSNGNFEGTEDYEDFFYEWNYYPFDMLRTIYTHTGWKLDEKFANMKPSYNWEGDDLFYRIDFFDVYDMIVSNSAKSTDADICFLYCTLILIAGIGNRKLYDDFALLVRNALIEYKLIKLLDMVMDGKKQIFVAMSFAKDMSKARKAIKTAIDNNGFNALVIDEKEYSNFIVPEMFMEIEKSAFVVADLTHQRGGVYYEAGYAQAFGIPVIMTCKKEDFNNVHFDVKQMNTIVWEDVDELQNKLSKRIEALTRKR
jgi:nucleoside 2-deoxyribosyltransferase